MHSIRHLEHFSLAAISCLILTFMVTSCSSNLETGESDSPDALTHDAERPFHEPEPVVCDPGYNTSLNNGSLKADLAGIDDYNGYESGDVSFSITDVGRDRPMLSIHAREWCLPGVQRSDLLMSCLLKPEDLWNLPLEINFTPTFISGKNSCKISFTNMRAIFRNHPEGHIIFTSFEEKKMVKGTFEASLEESTDPNSTALFKNGIFSALASKD
ncbi:MAG: hypothetical protein GXP49_17555 [Deltaproteobacteria bacterium]|nr:hypothetical protein [Deltaproteobacteria bacterium]